MVTAFRPNTEAETLRRAGVNSPLERLNTHAIAELGSFSFRKQFDQDYWLVRGPIPSWVCRSALLAPRWGHDVVLDDLVFYDDAGAVLRGPGETCGEGERAVEAPALVAHRGAFHKARVYGEAGFGCLVRIIKALRLHELPMDELPWFQPPLALTEAMSPADVVEWLEGVLRGTVDLPASDCPNGFVAEAIADGYRKSPLVIQVMVQAAVLRLHADLHRKCRDGGPGEVDSAYVIELGRLVTMMGTITPRRAFKVTPP